MGAKGKCEQEMNTLGQDLDEMAAEARMSEEKAQRTMVDAARHGTPIEFLILSEKLAQACR